MYFECLLVVHVIVIKKSFLNDPQCCITIASTLMKMTRKKERWTMQKRHSNSYVEKQIDETKPKGKQLYIKHNT